MKKKRILALAMAAVLCIGALAACGSNNSGNNTTGNNGTNNSTNNSGTNDTGNNSSNSGNDQDTATLEDVLGEVTEIKEDGSLELTLYSGGGTITDYAAVDLTAYTPTSDTDSYTIPDTATIYTVKDGSLTAAALSDIKAGDKVIISTDSSTSTITQVVIYSADASDSSAEA